MSSLSAPNPKRRPGNFAHLSLKGADKHGGRLSGLLGSPQSLQSATEISEHLRHWRRPDDSSHIVSLRSLRAPSGPEVARLPQKLEHSQNTRGRFKYWRAPRLFRRCLKHMDGNSQTGRRIKPRGVPQSLERVG